MKKLPEIKIRPAKEKDAPQLTRLLNMSHAELYKEPAPEDHIRHAKENHGQFMVAVRKGNVVGIHRMVPEAEIIYVDAGGNKKRVMATFLSSAFTVPGHRNKKVNSRLFAAVIERARREGRKILYVAAEGKKQPGLWEKRGFEKVGTCESCTMFNQGKCMGIPMYRKVL
ncbi:MAG: GNAT family N-acetyltransferase [Candidatus Diapherotrites archaeon]